MTIFKQKYGTPHETFPFDKATLADYEEAIMLGMEEENQEIDKIVNNPEPPTFENTIVAFEEAGDLLGEASEVFFNLISSATNDEMDKLAEKLSPLMSDHATDVCFNKRLFERIRKVWEKYSGESGNAGDAGNAGNAGDAGNSGDAGTLSNEDRKLLDDTYKGFVRSGIGLPKDKQDRLREISNEQGLLELKFSQNKLKALNAFTLHITKESDLDGLPQSAIDAARETAREKKKDGWVFTLHAPSMNPFMTYSTRRTLRKKMYMAYNTICTKGRYDNREVVKRIVDLAREEAQIMGYRCYADFVLEERMAKNTEAVYKLLRALLKAYKPAARRELKAIQALAPEPLQPWDMAFYSNKLQEKLYNINSEMLRPYFRLEKVKEGVFGLATRLYGITFERNDGIPVYNPDVETFDVMDRDGRFLAVLYCDFHPRSDKKSGAWMTTFKGQWKEYDGRDSRPHVQLVMNFTKPTPQRPALLTLGEVETFLHEFGHALHEIFADTRYGELSGTNVDWDFVELPSQIMENYAVEPEFLNSFASHYETGEPVPEELLKRIVDSRNFGVALGCLRQLSFGLLDMAYYTLRRPLSSDITTFERRAWKQAVITPQTEGTCMSVQFSHIMAGGYSAGYYSYKWAEVLDADAFSLFQENGIFDQKTAQSFRDNILSRGGTEDPSVLYRRFRGRDATIDALLRRTGVQGA